MAADEPGVPAGVAAAAAAAAATVTLPSPASHPQSTASLSSGLDILASASATAAPNPMPLPATPHESPATSTHDSSPNSSQHSSQPEPNTSTSTSHTPPFQWYPIVQDNSQPSADELKVMEKIEISALNHEHWKALTFQPLGDPEYECVDQSSFSWTIDRFNGTTDAPNTSLVMHSPAFKLAGLSWRLKLYPKGNETGYVSAYLECVDLQSAASSTPFEDGGDATFAPDVTKLILPSLATLEAPPPVTIRHRRCISTQFSIAMYNPQVPTVHYHRVTSHMFSKEAPDAGFSRFGPSSARDLGRRQYGSRAPMLQADSIALLAYVRVLKDPTGLLFADPVLHHSSLNQYSRLGLQRFQKHDFLEVGTNLLTAVMVLSFLSPVRKILYSVPYIPNRSPDQPDGQQAGHPLLRSLQEFLEDIRDPNSNCPVTCSVIDALENYGISIAEIQSNDVLMLIEKLRQILDRELQGSGTSIKSLFLPDGLRCKIPQEKTTSIRAGLRVLMETDLIFTDAFPRVMLVELTRWGFDHHNREWKRNSKPIPLNDPLRLTKDSAGAYRLYALVLHRGKYRSDRFQALIRPDVKTWYRIDGNGAYGLEFTQVTTKAALDEAQKYAYLAIYVKDDVAKSEMIEDSKTFQGHPEKAWQTTKVWDVLTGASSRPAAESTQDGDDVEMPDASVVLDPTKDLSMRFAEDSSKTLEDHLGQEYHKGEWKDDHWHGKGYHIYFNGDVYNGEFCEGKRHGTGFQTFQNGDTYDGEWSADKMHGEGVFTQAKTGNTFRGSFKDGQQDAPGTTTWRVAESRSRTCHVCWIQAQDAAFMDCGHVCACLDCARRIDTCPICRRPVMRAVKLHFS